LKIPENEPGFPIMPGKINPTRCEALTGCPWRCSGNDHAVALAGSGWSRMYPVALSVARFGPIDRRIEPPGGHTGQP
jgi:fumarate hydratase class II